MKIICFIPARGGSKSIFKKNLSLINGQPLIKWTIKAAKYCNIFDEIICSSDDFEILDVCESEEIICHKRSPSISLDKSHVEDAILEYFDENKRNKYGDETIIILLEPTSPFVRVKDIINVVHNLKNGSVCSYTIQEVFHTSHAWNQRKINSNNLLQYYFSERNNVSHKQEKPHLYIFGNCVGSKLSHILNHGKFFENEASYSFSKFPFCVNIDSNNELILANSIFLYDKINTVWQLDKYFKMKL